MPRRNGITLKYLEVFRSERKSLERIWMHVLEFYYSTIVSNISDPLRAIIQIKAPEPFHGSYP